MAEKKKFLLRVEPSMYNDLERWAADEYRSVNAHIEYILRDALKKTGRLSNNSKQILQDRENE